MSEGECSVKLEPTKEVVEVEHHSGVVPEGQKMSTVVVRSEPPAFVSSTTNKAVPYDEYRLELEAWNLSTELDKKKVAVAAARSLLEHVDGIRLGSRVLK